MPSNELSRISLRSLCEPRSSVFAVSKADTVADIGDLIARKIDSDRFFEENYATDGMKVLLRQVFERLAGRSDQGVFRLKQAMGGGKTHNLIAAGLLAQNPPLRTKILGELGIAADGREVRLAAFSGRDTDLDDYLWVHLAKQLGRADRFHGAANEPPGPATWTSVIGTEPTLILLDELPPFLVSLQGKSAGPRASEADRLVIALANLMAAILSNKLPNCCLVLSDLTGAWAEGSASIQAAISNATNEASRAASDIIPVKMDHLELYSILRTRLFKKLPERDEVAKVSQAYAAALKTGVQQGALPSLYERWAGELIETYPFHPGLQELFARFRENPGFQQTRETLRLARRMVAGIWNRPPESSPLLIHPHVVDFNDGDVETMLDRVNPSLVNARARDVAASGRATAEALASEIADQTPAECARLLYLSSLAVAVNALHGLTAEEVAAYLCAPGRDISKANPSLLTQIEDASWYLHRRTDGRWYYRDVKNVNSAIKDRAQTLNEDARQMEARAYLSEIFKPGRAGPGKGRLAYQKLLVFPTIADVQKELGADDLVLVIGQPNPQGLHPVFRQLWDGETFKNRLMFLGGSETFTKITGNAAYVKAAEDLIAEFKAQQMADQTPEMKQAKDARDRWKNAFLSALRETYTQLFYPGLDGRLTLRTLKLEFASNQFTGETAILDTLVDEKKYRDDVESDVLRTEFETFVFTAQTGRWKDLLEATARTAEWYLLPLGGHETMKAAAYRKDVWRDEGGGYVRRGPFPKEKTAVLVREESRDDDTGEATLQVSAKHGDRVHCETGGGAPTKASPVVENGRLKTHEMKVTFLAIDSTGEHETGDVYAWTNRITLKHKLVYRDGCYRLTLQAAPKGTIRYTLDNSNPRSGGIYDSEVAIPDGREVALAIAEAAGEWSEQSRIAIPKQQPGGGDVDPQATIDPSRPAEWRRRIRCDDRRRSFEVLAILGRMNGRAHGLRLMATAPQSTESYVDMTLGAGIRQSATDIEALAAQLLEKLGNGGDLQLTVQRLSFESGRALIEAAKEMGEELRIEEVRQ